MAKKIATYVIGSSVQPGGSSLSTVVALLTIRLSPAGAHCPKALTVILLIGPWVFCPKTVPF